MSTENTDKIEKAAEAIADMLILGKKVYADKSIDLMDVQYAPEAIKVLTKVVELVAEFPELKEELKDINGEEIVPLIVKAMELVKKVEQA